VSERNSLEQRGLQRARSGRWIGGWSWHSGRRGGSRCAREPWIGRWELEKAQQPQRARERAWCAQRALTWLQLYKPLVEREEAAAARELERETL